MDFKENTRVWHLTYHKEALRESDVKLVRALYEQRILALEKEIERLSSPTMSEETLILSL